MALDAQLQETDPLGDPDTAKGSRCRETAPSAAQGQGLRGLPLCETLEGALAERNTSTFPERPECVPTHAAH